jgi:hypothetical protein
VKLKKYVHGGSFWSSSVCICLMFVFVRLAMTPVASELFSKKPFATEKRRTKREALPKMKVMLTLTKII